MSSEPTHPITEALREVEKLLRRTVTDPVRASHGAVLPQSDEKQFLTAFGSTIETLEQLAEALSNHRLDTHDARGAFKQVAGRLRDAADAMELGCSRLPD